MRHFTLHSETWYAKNVQLGEREIDDISIYDESVGNEFRIVWKNIFEDKPPCWQLTIFNDAIDVLIHNLDVVFALKRLPQQAQPEEVCEMLLQLGFRDHTPREQNANPYKEGDRVIYYDDAGVKKDHATVSKVYKDEVYLNLDHAPFSHVVARSYFDVDRIETPILSIEEDWHEIGYLDAVMGRPSQADYISKKHRQDYIQGYIARCSESETE